MRRLRAITATNLLVFLVVAAIFHPNRHTSPFHVSALSAPSSPLTNTKWNLRLDVGLQPGTWMPKRHPGWCDSGARLPLSVDVEFNSQPSSWRESLVGPKGDTFVLNVISKTSTYVSEEGQQEVTFANGGWCIQRPTGDVRNAEGSSVRPEGLLRFWVDCPSGARKRDAEVFPGTRIFFTTGVWDDPEGLEGMREEYERVVDDLNRVVSQTREIRENAEGGDIGGVADRLKDFTTMVDNSKEFDRLKTRKEALERASPPSSASKSLNGVRIAPSGSLVIKGNNIPDWLPGSEYLILGTFSAKASEVEG
eukprot:CAMPEP_0172537382 /NCGR_PEP_ID=MMETSP1067-20121228/8991_1 /TAXON_ID=265564 ORGANISM="Thalassiosira punctigera, Strain Tpunct2005C2" /NCGR_SAMPLE_ID=MMETSP1067 /ASSEMBLY_ACC=CAM_ASM_000444 /LENGTH=307 /DNA_ID=CAMNT_0013322673 /DNA_START=49 /DNA_END=972 /DNA_ORIENTATION=+